MTSQQRKDLTSRGMRYSTQGRSPLPSALWFTSCRVGWGHGSLDSGQIHGEAVPAGFSRNLSDVSGLTFHGIVMILWTWLHVSLRVPPAFVVEESHKFILMSEAVPKEVDLLPKYLPMSYTIMFLKNFPPEDFGNDGRNAWWSEMGVGCYLCLVGGMLLSILQPTGQPPAHIRISHSKMSAALRLRYI